MLSLLGGKADKPFLIGPSPHLSATHSTRKIMWGMVGALLPIWFASLLFFRWDALKVSVLIFGSAACFESLSQISIGKKVCLQDGSTILTAMLLTFLLSPTTPWQLILVGSFVSIVIGKEMLGGLGQNIFHPALAGYLTLVLLFPDEMNQAKLLGGANLFPILISAVILVIKKWISWEASLFYLAVVGGGSFLFGRPFQSEVLNESIFLCAFLFVTDWVTTPVTKKGRILFAIGAGILTVTFRTWMGFTQAAAISIFLMNALTPWIDRLLRPHFRKARQS
ncbi:MAG: RnfABCDGE type electron transport complex subunit D [Candidatus Omnitrophica bacterium]|nr:RnfABCDGE type electron transport complex subunit D [Candidatus Omnitrophota bacterium]